MISREEFEEVAIRLLRFAAAHGLRSFFEIYTMGMLVSNTRAWYDSQPLGPGHQMDD